MCASIDVPSPSIASENMHQGGERSGKVEFLNPSHMPIIQAQGTEEGSMPRDLAEWRPDPEMMYGQSELAEILRKTIQGLPPGFRVVFVLRDVEGLSTEETAETLGLSVPAVKSRLLRARLQLRERLTKFFKARKNGYGQGQVH